MSKPYIVKCNIVLRDREIEAYRRDFIKQIEEDGVVFLPPGFELVDNEEMEKIYRLFKGMSPKMQSVVKDIMEIEQARGENK